jgi:hypothetical protein
MYQFPSLFVHIRNGHEINLAKYYRVMSYSNILMLIISCVFYTLSDYQIIMDHTAVILIDIWEISVGSPDNNFSSPNLYK